MYAGGGNGVGTGVYVCGKTAVAIFATEGAGFISVDVVDISSSGDSISACELVVADTLTKGAFFIGRGPKKTCATKKSPRHTLRPINPRERSHI
jgi:hypothetical protein